MSTMPERPSLPLIGAVFLREGNLTFGGGAPTVAAIQREVINKRQWIDLPGFSLCYALARMTPGTNLYAFCTANGWRLRGWPGALVAVLAASLPSCIIVAALTVGFDLWTNNRLARAAIDGAMAASVGILLSAFWLLAKPFLTKRDWLRSAVILLASIALSVNLRLSPILVLLLAAVAGYLWPERGEA